MRIPPGPLTNALVIANVIVALILLVPGLWENAVVAGGLYPVRFTSGNTGFENVSGLLPVWLTPFSSAFIHGGIFHLLLNMLMLLFMGRMTERVLGWQGLGFLYIAGMLAAAVVEIFAHPASTTPVIGASGAISAIIAAYLLLFPNGEVKNWGALPARWARPLQLLIMWGLINVMVGYVSPGMGMTIAIFPHIGGFIAGLILAKPILIWRYRNA